MSREKEEGKTRNLGIISAAGLLLTARRLIRGGKPARPSVRGGHPPSPASAKLLPARHTSSTAVARQPFSERSTPRQCRVTAFTSVRRA